VTGTTSGTSLPDQDCHDIWPDFAHAIADIGFRSILGLPLILDDRRIGSLDVYSERPRHWSEEAVGAALPLAAVGTASIVNATELAQRSRTAVQLQTALDSRASGHPRGARAPSCPTSAGE